MAEEKKKVTPPNAAMLIAIFVIQLVALFFQAIGSPYDVFKLNSDQYTDVNGCYSLWGRKQCGGNHAKAWHDARFKTCGVFEATMKAGATFTIISLFAIAMAAFTAMLVVCKCLKSKIPTLLFLLFGVVTTTVPWTTVAGLYHNSTCHYGRVMDQGKYAAGFAFLVVSWCLTVISFILSIFA